jgi:hypothetical protein
VNSQQIREDLRQADTAEMWRRRAIIGLSLVGMASMGAVSLLQTGIVEHLPDPPIDGFDSDQTNLSDVAYQFGVPDGLALPDAWGVLRRELEDRRSSAETPRGETPAGAGTASARSSLLSSVP